MKPSSTIGWIISSRGLFAGFGWITAGGRKPVSFFGRRSNLMISPMIRPRGVDEGVAGEVADVIARQATAGVGIMDLIERAGDMAHHGKDMMSARCHGGDSGLWGDMREVQPVGGEVEAVHDLAEEEQ
jgi:hypothetical protein